MLNYKIIEFQLEKLNASKFLTHNSKKTDWDYNKNDLEKNLEQIVANGTKRHRCYLENKVKQITTTIIEEYNLNSSLT